MHVSTPLSLDSHGNYISAIFHKDRSILWNWVIHAGQVMQLY